MSSRLARYLLLWVPCLAVAFASGCVTGHRVHTARMQWGRHSFLDGRISMELPGKANHPGTTDLVYVRLLSKRWIALTVGYFPVSSVEVYVYADSQPMLRVEGLQDVPAFPDFPRRDGVVQVRRTKVHMEPQNVFRNAVLRLLDGQGCVAVRVTTSPDIIDPEEDMRRVPIDDAVFDRILSSVRVDGCPPPVVELGEP